MSRNTYNDISIDVSDDWEDASIITFLAPPRDLDKPAKGGPQPSQRPNIILTRSHVAEGNLDLDAFAQAQEQMMVEAMPDLHVLDRGTLDVGEANVAVTREFSFSTPDGVVRQIQAYFHIDKTMFVLSGTGVMEPSFEKLRGSFHSMAKSLRVVRG